LGFISHPEGIEFYSDRGIDDSIATYEVGRIIGEIQRGINQIEIVFVTWRHVIYPQVDPMKDSLEWDAEVLGPIETSSAGPYDLYFRTGEMMVQSKRLYGVSGVWYCTDQARLYWLHYFNTQPISYEKFFTSRNPLNITN
jgi:hypothetical protein